MKRYAIFWTVYGWERGIKWAYLVRQSTTTNITFFPLEVGKPSTKSMLMSVHFWIGIGKGLSNPGYGIRSVFDI
jgi:hypothetical protein